MVGGLHRARLIAELAIFGYTYRVRFRAAELSTKLTGHLQGPDVDLDGVSIDSRTVAPGNLFVPLVAERDGHEFIPAALAAGAGGYLRQAGPTGGDGDGDGDGPGGSAVSPADGVAVIEVADTAAALTGLGQLARTRIEGPVIGITGSVGKTSTKDLIAAACGSSFVTHASEKSFNNELGVPLTLANAPADAEVVIIEMGARGVGHIAELAAVARPTIGVVTTVALAHSELFGSIEAVAAAKGELIEALGPDGVAVLNADDPLVAAMAARTGARVVTFGVNGGDVRAADVQLDAVLRPSFTLETPQGAVEVQLAVAGAHMVLNAAAAAAAALAVGVDLADIAAGLAGATLSPWRMEVVQAGSGMVIINDAYNANPTSMRAALEALAEIPASERIAVVGAMAELGVEGPGEHRSIAGEAAALNISLIAVGAPAYGPSALHVGHRSQVPAALGEMTEVGEGVALLVKGSRVAGLELLVNELLGSS